MEELDASAATHHEDLVMSTIAEPRPRRRNAVRSIVVGAVAALVVTVSVPAAGAETSLTTAAGTAVAPAPPSATAWAANDDVPVGEVPAADVPLGQLPDADAGTPLAESPGAVVAAGAVAAPPTKVLPAALDAIPGYQPSTSCDPNDKPGVLAFARLVSAHWGKTRYHTSRTCVLGDGTQHAEGRALDWTMNAYAAGDKALGDTVVAWLAANNGALARRFGIMYVIWNKRIWYTHRPATFETYTGSNPHTDHIHFSFTWDGAMGRTSWWTGTPVQVPDVGTCRVYAGQYAPRYTAGRSTPCPGKLPEPPFSAYPVTLPGATGSTVSLAQSLLGVPVDGAFGPSTLARLLAYQSQVAVPVTGVLDNATWSKLVASMPVPPFRQVVGAPDVTADGWGDVVAVDDKGRLAVFPGEAGGRLGPVRVFGTGWQDLRVYAPGDWNGDRLGDLVAVDPAGALWLYPGAPKGRFGARVQIGRGWTPFRIIPAGDVSGDRVPDLLAIDAGGLLWLYPGNGKGGFGRRVQVGRGWASFQLYAAGDQNRDGRTDILGINPAGRLYFYAGKGGGRFAAAHPVGRGWAGYTFASGADLNRDGTADLISRDSAGALWLYPGRVGVGFFPRRQLATGW